MDEMNQIFGSDSSSEEAEDKEVNGSASAEEEVDQNSERDEENGEEQSEGEKEDADADADEGEEAADDEVDVDNAENKSNSEKSESNDDDDSNAVRKKSSKAAVFGDDLADLSDDDESNKGSDEAGEETNEAPEQVIEEEEEVEPEQLINLEIPSIKIDLGKELHFCKLPNFLSIEPKPFDADNYEDEPKGETFDEEGQTRVKLKVENTIRWKYDKDEDGNLTKLSNARIVKWSDDSYTMHLGSEIFDVCKMPMQHSDNHLFVRQANVLQSRAVFHTKLTFRPYSTESKTHRKMIMSMVEHGSKQKKVKILTDIKKNPEHNRMELMKKEEEKLKAAARRANQQRRLREKSHSKGLSTGYLEDQLDSEDEEDAAFSINAIKNNFKHRRNESKISSSSDESDRERRLNKAKSNALESSSEEEVGSDSDEHSHRGSSNKKKKTKKVVEDDDEE